ncbi:MAG: alpha-amylase family glycosyl hydrolase [Nitrospirota bacterium]
MVEKRLTELNFGKLCQQRFFPSPTAWEDQVIYFLMLDRFSDGKENGYINNDGKTVTTGTTPLYSDTDRGNATKTKEDWQKWFNAGGKFVGGNLKGLESKIGYLKQLGITAIWISPIFKQVAFEETYHGYGIQNFLDIDPHFGTRADLKSLVKTAHKNGIYVILDVILNHTGDVFEYDADRYNCHEENGKRVCDPPWDGNPYRVKGFRDKAGKPTIPFGQVNLQKNPSVWPDGAIWPAEFQQLAAFTQKGHINNWDYHPEYLEGDFCSLKNVNLGYGRVENFEVSPALLALCEVYKFWIAYADIDGFRIDTVKHMDIGATRFFASVIHEFTQDIGKENFYLIGEITGGRNMAFVIMEETGLNAALGIDDIPDKLEYLVKGYRHSGEYFDLFRNSLLIQKESHIWFRNKVVTTFDDHDQVRKGVNKARFCYDEIPGQQNYRVVLNAMALNATTMGIPCIYYGTEQYFNGHGNNDRYIRESMFGGEFGAFETRSRHFFNENSPVYKELAKILEIRKEKIALRRGRQYLRLISGNGIDFGFPTMIGSEIRSVVSWSRIFNVQEILCAINTDYFQSKTAWVKIDNYLHKPGDRLKCIYSTDKNQINKEVTVEDKNGNCVLITTPPAGFVIYE